MTSEELNAYWTRNFPECPQVGYLFKHLYRDRCARFHVDQNGDLERQHALFEHLFEGEARIILITTIPSELETPPAGAPEFLNFDPQGKFLHSLGMHEFELEFATPSYWHLFMSEREYRPGMFDPVLRASSEGSSESGVLNTLFLGPARRRLLYVYPGGMDTVLENPARADQVRSRFGDWLF